MPTDGLAYSALLKNELLGAGIEKVQDPQTEDRRLQPSTPERKGLFTVSPTGCPRPPVSASTGISSHLSPAWGLEYKRRGGPLNPVPRTRPVALLRACGLEGPRTSAACRVEGRGLSLSCPAAHLPIWALEQRQKAWLGSLRKRG